MKNLLVFLSFLVFGHHAVQSQAFLITDFTMVGTIGVNQIIGTQGGTTADMSLLGGEIDYVVTNDNGNSSIAVDQQTFFMGGMGPSGYLSGSIEYIWDGVDGDAFNMSFNTVVASLGNCGDITIDFSGNSSSIGSILDFDMTIEMYNSVSNYISWTGPVSIADMPVSVPVNTSLFQSFGGVFDFNNVRAMRVILSTDLGSNLAADILTLSWVPDLSIDAMCDPIPAVPPIPTMGQWGIIMLGLLTMVFGIVMIRQRKTIFA